LRGYLENLASELGISNRVSFTGNIQRDVAPYFFQGIDAFVHPSRYETFGIVLVEALASGRPVVATRCGGPNDIVREEDGILVAVDDVDGLASAMNELRSHQWDSSAMRAGVEERYTKKIIREKLLTIYNSLI
jgi:glycosyltransferase involved in cell wall biosynthesis